MHRRRVFLAQFQARRLRDKMAIMATTTPKLSRDVSVPLSSNQHLLRWVEKMADLTKPKAIHWVDGTKEEYDHLCQEMVDAGTFVRLNQDLWPGCYYARSDASDVA